MLCTELSFPVIWICSLFYHLSTKSLTRSLTKSQTSPLTVIINSLLQLAQKLDILTQRENVWMRMWRRGKKERESKCMSMNLENLKKKLEWLTYWINEKYGWFVNDSKFKMKVFIFFLICTIHWSDFDLEKIKQSWTWFWFRLTDENIHRKSVLARRV